MPTTLGQVVRLTGTVHDTAGALFDPVSVMSNVTDPAGVTTSNAATRDSIGLYHYDYTPAVAGNFSWWFSGTGTAQDVDIFTVWPAASTALISLGDAKAHLNKTVQAFDPTDTDDVELLAFIHSATSIVNNLCGYTAPTPCTETVTATVIGAGRRVLMLSKTPVLSVQSITSRQIGMPAVDIATLNINNESGIVYLGNWFQWYGPQQVAYTAGRTSVPAELQDACKVIVAWLWETQRGGGVSALALSDDQTATYGGMPGLPVRALDLMRLSPSYAAPGLA